jgi:NADH-quinone oxidoreductase subunit C
MSPKLVLEGSTFMAEDAKPGKDMKAGVAGPLGSGGARGIPVPPDQPSGSWHPAIRALEDRFGRTFEPFPLAVNAAGPGDQVCIKVPPDRLLEVMRFLKQDSRCRFDLLADLTCVDYLYFPNATDRYGVTYSLVSTGLRHRLWVKCFLNDPEPAAPSVTSIWKGANWPEREVWDMFGVRFEGHPDLRRILLWEGFGSHPLRKDYPPQGLGERADFEILGPHSA